MYTFFCLWVLFSIIQCTNNSVYFCIEQKCLVKSEYETTPSPMYDFWNCDPADIRTGRYIASAVYWFPWRIFIVQVLLVLRIRISGKCIKLGIATDIIMFWYCLPRLPPTHPRQHQLCQGLGESQVLKGNFIAEYQWHTIWHRLAYLVWHLFNWKYHGALSNFWWDGCNVHRELFRTLETSWDYREECSWGNPQFLLAKKDYCCDEESRGWHTDQTSALWECWSSRMYWRRDFLYQELQLEFYWHHCPVRSDQIRWLKK